MDKTNKTNISKDNIQHYSNSNSNINTLLITNGMKINLKDIEQKELTKIKSELTVIPHTLDFNEENRDKVENKLYILLDQHIIIPRYYGIEKFGKPTTILFNPHKCDFKFKCNLRDYQIPIVEKCLEYMKQHGGGLLSVPCGAGKTTMALKIASTLGLKTLVIVHKTFLQDQWIERAQQFTNAKIGTIRQKIVDVKDKDIVIGLIQSISKRDYGENIFGQFGIVIYDECHHVASKMFSKALIKTGAQYTIGLSATPYRTDGLIKVMHWYIGKIMYQIKLKTNNQVLSKIITYHSDDPTYKEYARYIGKKLRPDCVKMCNNIVDLPVRNTIIINIINHLRKNPDRKLLILSGRKRQLTFLKTEIDKLIALDIENGLIIKNEYNTCYYTGDLNKTERTFAEKYGDMLFATYDMAHEGLDIDRLNTIIMATPKKNVVQAVGRILRKVLEIGDTRPLVIDIRDSLSVFNNHGIIREKFYEKSHYKIDYLYIKNDVYISPHMYSKIFGNINNNLIDTCSNDLNIILNVPLVEIISDDKDKNIKKNKISKCLF